ncbi:MAG: cell division protein FtsQ/DivIB [Methyloligellaceae bacterium]
MQPLGGKTGKRQGRKKRFWQRNSQADEGRLAGIALSMSHSWHGHSQTPGRKHLRGHAGWSERMPRSWRVAAVGFMSTAVVYGLSVGGYFGRSADFAAKRMSTIMVSAGFSVNRVTIEGQNRVGNPEILRALRLDRSVSTLGFDTAAAQQRLEKLPLIRRARVMRLLPSQLHVVIEERVPYAIWQHNSALQLVDQDGTVIEKLKSGAHPDLPLVVGAGAAENARDLLDELAHWPRVKAKVQAAIRVGNRRWNLKLANGMEIRLPEGDTARALKKVAELDRTQKILSGDAVAVDLRLSGRVTIRLRDDAASRRDSAFSAREKKIRRPGQDA